MSAFKNPALEAFTAHIKDRLILGQVLIRRVGSSYELRHVADQSGPDQDLRTLSIDQLREFAQFTAAGAFRPLHSAPNLRNGWRLAAGNDAILGSALDQLYPGAIPDWYAAQDTAPPVTHYREFANRQSGMYRITALLEDAQVVQVIHAACPNHFCLKRRLWTVPGTPIDAPSEKSMIPCLEPCALFLEFARKTVRVGQEKKVHLDLAPADLATLIRTLRTAVTGEEAEVREGDFDDPANSRRIQLLLLKLEAEAEKMHG